MEQDNIYQNQLNYTSYLTSNMYNTYMNNYAYASNYTSTFVNVAPTVTPRNRFVYVNQDKINCQIHPQMYSSSIANVDFKPNNPKKVLVNPNFKPTQVHVNPNFNNSLAPMKHAIHINPNMLRFDVKKADASIIVKKDIAHKNTDSISSDQLNFNASIPKKVNTNLSKTENTNVSKTKPLISTRTKLIRDVSKSNSNMPKGQSFYEPTKIVKNQYKLDNRLYNPNLKKDLVPTKTEPNVNHKLQESTKHDEKPIATRKRKMSFHSTYKIIRKCIGKENDKDGKSRKVIYKSKFKIERKSASKTPPKIKRISNTRYSLVNSSSSTATKKIVKKLVGANRVYYKPVNTKKIGLKKTVMINGQKFKMGRNQRSLKRLSDGSSKYKKVNVKKNTSNILIFNIPKVIVKAEGNKRKLIFSEMKSTSLILPNKMKKSNVPCPVYRRLGKCSGKDNGKCIRIHNPDQIALCTKFLQGACINENCLLSHKVSAEKMPTCKFFLEGLCSKENCSYLHVKINAKADICKDFLEGFCEKAAECDKRHQYLCPDFEKHGKCPKCRCPYPHGIRVRNTSLLAVAKKFNVNNVKKSNLPKQSGSVVVKKVKSLNNDLLQTAEGDKLNIRYYTDIQVSDMEILDHNTKKSDTSLNELKVSSEINNLETRAVQKRPKLGELPSFIPFTGNSSS